MVGSMLVGIGILAAVCLSWILLMQLFAWLMKVMGGGDE